MKKELDLDVIGGLGSLTKKEEKELNHFFKQRKLKKETSFEKTDERNNLMVLGHQFKSVSNDL